MDVVSSDFFGHVWTLQMSYVEQPPKHPQALMVDPLVVDHQRLTIKKKTADFPADGVVVKSLQVTNFFSIYFWGCHRKKNIDMHMSENGGFAKKGT